MFQRPYVAGIDAKAILGKRSTLQNLLSDYGNNIGNIMFSESLYRNLANPVRGSLHFTQSDVADCDVIVLAAANWINPYSDFGPLAERIERTGLPLVIVGIGAQSGLENEIPEIHPGTLRLIRYAASTSNIISTRGGFSSRVLNYYGIENCLATGCPSLLMNGKSARIDLPTDAPVDYRDIALHSTRHLFNNSNDFQRSIYREAVSKNADIILQSELADMYYALGRLNNSSILSKASIVIEEAYGRSVKEVSQYLRVHGKVLFTVNDWVSYLKNKKFSIGTRLHGTVASLLAGTPAVLIAHDSRTLETAEAMSIPTIRQAAIEISSTDPNELLRSISFESYLNGYERYRQNFKAFFFLNRLETSDELDS